MYMAVAPVPAAKATSKNCAVDSTLQTYPRRRMTRIPFLKTPMHLLHRLSRNTKPPVESTECGCLWTSSYINWRRTATWSISNAMATRTSSGTRATPNGIRSADDSATRRKRLLVLIHSLMWRLIWWPSWLLPVKSVDLPASIIYFLFHLQKWRIMELSVHIFGRQGCLL